MRIAGCVGLVTGANRGIGRAFVDALLDRGARLVYATSRHPAALTSLAAAAGGRVEVLDLDVTNANRVAAAAAAAGDVSLLVNNAGVLFMGGFLSPGTADQARAEMEANYFGILTMARAFAPVLAANGGGAMVNVLSIAACVNMPFIASYSASKAAASSLTQGLRGELKHQGTHVVGVYPGPVDTDMAASLPVDKVPAAAVARAALDAVADGVDDVYPDPYAADVMARLATDPKLVERKFADMAPAPR